jgi:hypothetical protein
MKRAGPLPPAASRFRKGQSGNPKGRPKAGPRTAGSAFDVVTDRSLTVTQNGRQRELTVEEALQHRTYQDAIAGSRLAQRQVLKMIAKREKWLAARGKRRPRDVKLVAEAPDPDNADEVLLLLGIAEPHNRLTEPTPDGRRRLLLRPWAVQLALSRGRRQLSAQDISDINRSTRDSDTLRWPGRARDAQGE